MFTTNTNIEDRLRITQRIITLDEPVTLKSVAELLQPLLTAGCWVQSCNLFDQKNGYVTGLIITAYPSDTEFGAEEVIPEEELGI